jgi:4-oxalocrotonate tautomerase family enzyme
MPIITVEGPPITDIDKRRKLTESITLAAADAYGMPRDKIIILIHENRPDQVAVGGMLISDREK